jgi:hypothetical protein
MIKLLIALCVVFISPLATAEWIEFSKGTDSKYYYDPETLTNKRYTRVMILINYKNKNKKDKWVSEKTLYEANCKFKQLRMIKMSIFDGEMGEGNMVGSRVRPENWGYVPRDTQYLDLLNLLCGGKN